MSFDHIPHPHSDDPHAECNLEIHRLKADVEKWRARAFMPQGDNHHNAAQCPYCSPQSEIVLLQAQLAAVRAKLETIVCTDEIDQGVVLLNHEGGSHIEVIGGREVTVYNHEYFSPLGDALIELWELTKGKE